MHQMRLLVRRIYYGFDSRMVYLRIDPDPALFTPEQAEHSKLVVMIFEPRLRRFEFTLRNAAVQCYEQNEDGAWVLSQQTIQVAIDHIVEMAIDMRDLDAHPGDRLVFQVIVQRDAQEVERCPLRDPILMEIPEKDYEERMWMV